MEPEDQNYEYNDVQANSSDIPNRVEYVDVKQECFSDTEIHEENFCFSEVTKGKIFSH